MANTALLDDAVRPGAGPRWLTIVLTWRCPAACAHCGVESSPRNRVVLDRALARRAVLEAARFEPRPRLAFTGGEPFVELDALHELVALARDHGMSSEVVTSAAWVADQARCQAVLAQLKAEGLVTLCVSFDRFHTEYIPVWKVTAAVRAGLAIGLRIILKTIIDPAEPETPEALAAALQLSDAEMARCVVNGQPLSGAGRAADLVDSRADREGEPIPGGCMFAGQNPTLSPAGRLYPCCGPIMGKLGPAAELFTIADLSEATSDTVGAALNHGATDLFTALLHRAGPAGIIAAVKARNPDLKLHRTFDSQCAGCEEIMSNPTLREGVHALLRASRLAPHG